MKKLTVLLAAMMLSISAMAKMRPGDNIVQNGRFELNQTERPMCWIGGTDLDGVLTATQAGGPDGMPALLFKNDTAAKRSFTYRQFGLNLKAGETYRISARVRTKAFKYGRFGIIVANLNWAKDDGIKSVQADCEWTLLQKDITLMDSANGKYFVAMFAIDFTGELDVADLKLEAISEGALKSTEPSDSDDRAIRIVPWEPLLDKIPAGNPVVSFNFFGRLPSGDYGEYDLSVNPEGAHEVVQPLVKGVNKIRLPAKAKGGRLEVSVIHRSSGDRLIDSAFHYSLINVPKVSSRGHRRLNNLVTEVLNSEFKAKKPAQKYKFDTLRDGWIFIKAEEAFPDGLEISLDNEGVIIGRGTPRLEAFRLVPMGTHAITVKGAAKDGRLIVRSIAEVFDYCPGNNNFVPTNPPFDWEFQKKYLHPAVTTYNGGVLTEEQVDYIKKLGQRWMGTISTTLFFRQTPFPGIDEFNKTLDACVGMKSPLQCGVTCDEQFFGQHDVLTKYIAALRKYEAPQDKSIYSWFVGKPSANGLDNDIISACVNASDGRGMILSELYCTTRPDEESARKSLDSFITDTMKMYKKHFPHIEEHLGLILGNFNQVPLISLIHHPEVDYKYFLDMQLNLIANDPEFKDLACTGYWGSYYGDHELHRWSMLLLRHYCIEGRKDMLSDKYGFSYKPDHVLNGDFRGTLEPWAASGDVTVSKVQGFAATSQLRWGSGDGTGDSFAVLAKKDGKASSLTQVAKGLVPGKAYLLQFASFDMADFGVNPVKSHKLGIGAKIDNATIREDLSWLYVNNRQDGKAPQKSFAPINLHHIVFIANGAEATVTIDNEEAGDGERLGVNMLSLNPFLLEE